LSLARSVGPSVTYKYPRPVPVRGTKCGGRKEKQCCSNVLCLEVGVETSRAEPRAARLGTARGCNEPSLARLDYLTSLRNWLGSARRRLASWLEPAREPATPTVQCLQYAKGEGRASRDCRADKTVEGRGRRCWGSGSVGRPGDDIEQSESGVGHRPSVLACSARARGRWAAQETTSSSRSRGSATARRCSPARLR
jgi:hypothetical protein